ncbi:DUF4012 domain-containing protein [Pseudosporangium ferrugineum]|uniref:Uncharacterized protein DUF4012 n=1 Tax=Pseudosporangium ferrugineum TaxID=439699 RepID=A0A2T0S3D5_9ACTN|nr:DUF4012 domain-containing protein [Pseudosporangium ferrugineum]PRY27917.1 uncharacterized protein DUF4012 [Pseudosporangium ferrugineum]
MDPRREVPGPEPDEQAKAGTPRRRWVRRSLIAAGVVGCLVAAGGTWVGARGLSARDHLQAAAALVPQLRAQLTAGDPGAARTLAALQAQTRAARADTSGRSWRVAARLPAVGDEIAAVRTMAAALDDLARDGLPALVETAATVGPAALTPKDGRIDLAPLQRAAPRLAAADAAVRRARERVDGIALDGLREPVRSAVGDLRAQLADAAAVTATADRSATLLPSLLGAEGRRTYLVLFQNPAELRATGGMPGAFVVLRADRGRIGIIDQGAASDWLVFDRPVLPLRPADRSLWTDKLGVFPADVNVTPHFPTAASLAREMYRRRSGRTVDGVFATDPVALSYLLRVIGPVPVPGGPALTGANTVPTLLSRMYARDVSVERQDAFFAAAARATFDAMTSRSFDAPRLLAALARAAGERRLLVWSARHAENRQLAGTVLTGVLPAADGARPTVGLFLNDGSGAKLGYYLRQSVAVSTGGCRSDGRRRLTVRLTLRSVAPRAGLPPYVLGLGLAGDPYTARTVVAVYSPAGGHIERMSLDGARTMFGSGLDRGRGVGQVVVDVPAGGSRTLEVTVLTGELPRVPVRPRLWVTPAVAAWQESIESADVCPSDR